MNEETPRTGFCRVMESLPGVFTRGRYYAVIGISAVSFCLIINSSWNATPDSALYLSLGESIAAGNGYVFNGEQHTFVPPGYPLMVAVAAWLSGPNFLGYRILMALAGLLTSLAGYLFVRRLCGKDVGLVIGGTFAVNHALLYHCAFALSDVPFALFVLIALHVLLSAGRSDRPEVWAVVAGLAVGILPIIRVNGLGVLPVAALYLACSWKDMKLPRRCLWIGGFLLAALAPEVTWLWWKASFPVSGSEGTYYDAVFARRISDQLYVVGTTFYGYFAELSYALSGVYLRTGLLEFILPLLTAVGMVQAFRDGDRLLAPLAAVQFCGLLLSSPGSRYLIFLLPALYLFLALGIVTVLNRFARYRRDSGSVRGILIITFAAVAALNVVHNAITIVHARSALESNGAESERSLPFFVASRWLKANAPNATVLTTRSRIIHYLSGCPTVTLLRSGVPEHEIWVQSRDEIGKLMAQRNPGFLFTDSSKAELYRLVIEALQDLGMKLEPIAEANTTQRYQLYRIVRPPSPG